MLQREVFKRFQLEIYGVQVLRFPLEDLWASSWVVWHCILSENQPIVAMLQTRNYMFENSWDSLHRENIFHVNVNNWCSLRSLPNQSRIT